MGDGGGVGDVVLPCADDFAPLWGQWLDVAPGAPSEAPPRLPGWVERLNVDALCIDATPRLGWVEPAPAGLDLSGLLV